MKTQTLRFSWILRLILMLGVLFIAIGYTSMATAANGCGWGFHRNYYGVCTWNHPGRWATPAPNHPGCWHNYRGQLRCR